MKKIKKWVAFLLIFCTAVVIIPQTVRQVKAATQSEALTWVRSKVGTVVEADGSSPGSATYAQCVDLIKAYYIYLVGYSVSGNGADYATNALPSGWQRIQGASPQPGDILVYSGNSANPYGHVAIYESDYVTYHQNFDNHPYVERITFRYNGLTNPYWGVIRPNFSGGGGSSLTTAWQTNCSYTDDNNAIIHATISTDRSVQFTNAGAYVWTQNGNLVAQASEGTSVSGYYMDIQYNIWGEMGTMLNPGTTYTYQFWATAEGTTYYSEKGTFRTSGSSPVIAWQTNCSYTDDNNAIIHATISTDQSVQFTNAGAYVWDQNGNLVAQASEGTSVSGYYMDIQYNIVAEMGTVLKAATTYTYQFWAITGGTTYYSEKETFRTGGGYNPEGVLETLTGGTGSITLGGWTFDRDNLSEQLRLDIYVGGDAGSGHCYQIYADDERTDIDSTYPGVGNYHGFYETISVSEVGNQEVYVYAINVGEGQNVLLGSKTVNILSIIKGDIDGDGTVTIFDAGLIIDMVYGRAEPDISLADLDGDGTVTIFDAGAAIDLVYKR